MWTHNVGMTRNLFVKFRCNETEKDVLKYRAHQAHMTLSDFIRKSLGVSTKKHYMGKVVSTLLETKGKKMCPQCEKMISKRGYHRHTKYCTGE